jgi:TetR/AcrR family transcriptional repressor of nem operon
MAQQRKSQSRSDRTGSGDTASRILDVAERLVQQRGFNGFSYADIASEMNVTKASLHYHFRGKAELGRALIERYANRFADALDSIDRRESDAAAKIQAYAEIYANVLRQHRMCLCGMLAAGYDTLAPSMREAVVQFFDANEAWLTRVLQQGVETGQLQLTGPVREAAQVIVSGLEGAMLIARPYNDVDRFNAAAARLVTGVVHPHIGSKSQ